MAYSKFYDKILFIWAPVLVATFVIQQHLHHHHNLVLGFEYIEWKEFKSRDDASLGISLKPRSSSNGKGKGNDTASNPSPITRTPRYIDFYGAYGWMHVPLYNWTLDKVGDLPLPIEDPKNIEDWHLHLYLAQNSLFPSQSLIILKDKEGKPHACGCILLHTDLIITTRRCIESKVAAKVVFRRHLLRHGILEDPTVYAFVKGFCVLDKNSKDYENDVAVGYLTQRLTYQGLVWPAAALPDDKPPIVQHVGLVREGSFNGYNILQKGCPKSAGGEEKDRTCYTTTTNGSRHICEGVDQGMGVYHLTGVEGKGSRQPRIYLAGIMSQAEQKPPGCQKETSEGQWVYYVDFKKIPRLKEMITKCYS